MPTRGSVTEARRQAILWCLWIHGALNPASVTKLLAEHIKLGDIKWPQADWFRAVNAPYEVGTRQHLDAMAGHRDGRVRRAGGTYAWNPEVLTPREHATEVKRLRAQQVANTEIATRLGIGHQLVSGLYHDPFGLREKERKARYCPGCGKPKTEDETVCPGCVRRRRLQQGDDAEALLPDCSWARSLPVLCPIDFAVTEHLERVLIVHTGRGRIERFLARGESWEHAVADAGILRT